jgi:hypothetical protein
MLQVLTKKAQSQQARMGCIFNPFPIIAAEACFLRLLMIPVCVLSPGEKIVKRKKRYK